ncbi:hypothetical protein HPC49_00495 [Pyxidicoccus fallax]|uniref:Uncharacterized protein n=1 Tax=Pyxidicoccus fallax TaxID=394095 RepID=A0A848L4H3_9BACT|nr:hypothetical protein [Pyxidicoccus fallax]NMO13559.1 hypothetical protein [Pyxidicoccus fallax]NPC76733.1 hypothetical protein [Pyxidicoccus fallax]
MAINPETAKHAVFIVDYEKWTSSGAREHRIVRLGHNATWAKLAEKSRLEPSWNSIPEGKSKGKKPFPTEETPVNSGTGSMELKWKVWDDANKLTNNEVELYSVMRAEKRYIDEGFKKLGSKYVQTLTRGSASIDVENCGVDSFFWHEGKQTCVFCESKFTRSPAKFESWKADKRRVWQLMGRYKTGDGNRCRQMSWSWIRDRARKALLRPVGLAGLSTDQKASGVEQCVRMLQAANDRRGKRMVNIFGAAEVPVYPGIYLVVLGEAGAPSVNELPVEWPFPMDDKEFIELGEDFDNWLQSQSSHDAEPAPSSIILPT